MASHAIASSSRSHSGETTLLLRILDESYERKAWHGPNLKGSIRGLSALRRPGARAPIGTRSPTTSCMPPTGNMPCAAA